MQRQTVRGANLGRTGNKHVISSPNLPKRVSVNFKSVTYYEGSVATTTHVQQRHGVERVQQRQHVTNVLRQATGGQQQS